MRRFLESTVARVNRLSWDFKSQSRTDHHARSDGRLSALSRVSDGAIWDFKSQIEPITKRTRIGRLSALSWMSAKAAADIISRIRRSESGRGVRVDG